MGNTCEPYSATYEGEELADFTYSLTLQDSIDINFYAKDLAGQLGEYTVENGKVKMVVEGIAAKDLAKTREIVVADPAGGTFKYTVSPVDYMGLAIEKGSQVGLNCAFYNYYAMAAALLDDPRPGPALLAKRPLVV